MSYTIPAKRPKGRIRPPVPPIRKDWQNVEVYAQSPDEDFSMNSETEDDFRKLTEMELLHDSHDEAFSQSQSSISEANITPKHSKYRH
jgi:hypothetical protein